MDDKLATDEARRSVQHETVKAQVEGEVQSEIADRASQGPPPGEAAKIDQVAGQFRSKAVNEVVDTEREVERGRGAARISGRDPAGRPLFAAHATLPWPDRPHLALWHAATLYREFRG